MTNNLFLYFIAIIPPQQLCSFIDEKRKQIAKKYNAYHALKTIPHVTLISPFKRSADNEVQLHLELQNYFEKVTPFSITINGFGNFQRQNKVVFFNVDKSKELISFHRNLVYELRNKLHFSDKEASYMYHPHITIAHKDLSNENFELAWNELEGKEFTANFQCNKVALLRHNYREWEILSVFSLQQP